MATKSIPTPTNVLFATCTMRIPHAVLSIALLASFGLAQKANDVVVKKDGARLRGIEITELTITGLKAKKGNDAIEVPPHQLLAIEWGDLPEAFVSARAALERGDYGNAAQLFGDAERGADRPLVKADCLFFQLKAAVAGLGTDKAAAATAADKAKAWLGANAAHWRLPEAMLLAGRALRLAGNGTEAATTLRELDERSVRDGFGPVWSARAKFELAMTLVADGKASEARTSFQSAGSAADNALGTPSADDAELRNLKTQAKVGEGETFLAEKQWAKAESFFKNLAGGQQAELVAAGRAGEGEAILLAALESKNPADLRRAQIALATASVMDTLSGEASAKANFYLGKCLLALGMEREGDTFKARANAYFQVVATNYPTSRWAAAARTELGK